MAGSYLHPMGLAGWKPWIQWRMACASLSLPLGLRCTPSWLRSLAVSCVSRKCRVVLFWHLYLIKSLSMSARLCLCFLVVGGTLQMNKGTLGSTCRTMISFYLFLVHYHTSACTDHRCSWQRILLVPRCSTATSVLCEITCYILGPLSCSLLPGL